MSESRQCSVTDNTSELRGNGVQFSAGYYPEIGTD